MKYKKFFKNLLSFKLKLFLQQLICYIEQINLQNLLLVQETNQVFLQPNLRLSKYFHPTKIFYRIYENLNAKVFIKQIDNRCCLYEAINFLKMQINKLHQVLLCPYLQAVFDISINKSWNFEFSSFFLRLHLSYFWVLLFFFQSSNSQFLKLNIIYHR